MLDRVGQKPLQPTVLDIQIKPAGETEQRIIGQVRKRWIFVVEFKGDLSFRRRRGWKCSKPLSNCEFYVIANAVIQSYQRQKLLTGMSPIAHADGCNGFGFRDEPFPGVATGIEDGLVVLEDAVGEPVLAQVLPDVLDRVQFRGT